MRPPRRWIHGVALALVVSGCGGLINTPDPPTPMSTAAGVAAVIGECAPAITNEFLAAGFVRVMPEPALVRAVKGRPLVTAVHDQPRGFASVTLFDDPVSRVTFAVANDDEAFDVFRALLVDRGLVEARDWLDAQQARADKDPTADIAGQVVLSGGLSMSYKREVAGNDPSTAVVTVIIG